MRSIYFDYNATTPVRPEVVEAMRSHLAGPPGNPSSRHRYGREAEKARETAREQVARAAGCRPEEVVFTSGGTEADNLALRGRIGPGRIGPGRGTHVVTAATEHEAILHTVHALEAEGAEITILPVDGRGLVDPEAVREALRPETAVVTVMAANNETGVLAPLAEIGAICREAGVPFHTDAVQCFGKIDFRFDALPLDLASISSHKIGGPKGIGALLQRPAVTLHPTQTGGGQERRIRPGTENLPGIVGFGEAAECAIRDLGVERKRLETLRDRFETGIRGAFPSARIHGIGAARLPNCSNVSFPPLDGESLMIALDLEGVAVSTGAACTAGASDPSHVLLAMGETREAAGSSLRFSLGAGSTDAEVSEVLSILSEIAARMDRAGPTP